MKTLIQKYKFPLTFTIAKIWKQTKCSSMNGEDTAYVHNGLSLGHKKGWNLAIYSMDRPWEYYAK